MTCPLRFNMDGAIAQITLCDSARLNVLDRTLCEALLAAVNSLASLPSVRVLTLAAEGRSFSAGGDLAIFAEGFGSGRGEARATMSSLHACIRAIRALAVPVVVAAQGITAGGGLGLALAGDMLLLSDDATLLPAHRRLGAPADGGLTWFASRALGPRAAYEWLLTGRAISAEEAVRLGLATRVVPLARMDASLSETAQAIAEGAKGAASALKRLVHQAPSRSLDKQLDDEQDAFFSADVSVELAAGIQSFLTRARLKT